MMCEKLEILILKSLSFCSFSTIHEKDSNFSLIFRHFLIKTKAQGNVTRFRFLGTKIQLPSQYNVTHGIYHNYSREVESQNSSYFIKSDLDYRNLIECAMRLVDMNNGTQHSQDTHKVWIISCIH